MAHRSLLRFVMLFLPMFMASFAQASNTHYVGNGTPICGAVHKPVTSDQFQCAVGLTDGDGASEELAFTIGITPGCVGGQCTNNVHLDEGQTTLCQGNGTPNGWCSLVVLFNANVIELDFQGTDDTTGVPYTGYLFAYWSLGASFKCGTDTCYPLHLTNVTVYATN